MALDWPAANCGAHRLVKVELVSAEPQFGYLQLVRVSIENHKNELANVLSVREYILRGEKLNSFFILRSSNVAIFILSPYGFSNFLLYMRPTPAATIFAYDVDFCERLMNETVKVVA